MADCRESPAVEVVRRLRVKGADVACSDPHVPLLDDLASVPLDGLDAYDAVVVLTPHPALDLARVARGAALVLDTRAALPAGPRVHRLQPDAPSSPAGPRGRTLQIRGRRPTGGV